MAGSKGSRGNIGDPPGGGDYQALTAGSADVNTVTTADGILRYVSSATLRLFGWEPSALEGKQFESFLHPDDINAWRDGGAELAAGRVTTTAYRFRRRDGSFRWSEATSRRVEADGRDVIVSTIRDIEQRRKAEAILQRRAFTDPLTEVANRFVLMDRMHQALNRLRRGTGLLAVLYLDLDRFKVVNDSLGHRIGDAVLLKMAERLTHHLRPADTLARLGGDEFVILAEDIENEEAVLELGTRIVEAGRDPFRIGAEEFVCTVSIGIAWASDGCRNAEELLQEADLALYRAKERGRDRVDLFDEELRSQAVGKVGTERMLRRALKEHQIVVEYQPVLDLRRARITGAEALVRIRDPERGLLKPDAFLDVAVESGLLTAMDEHVMADAIQRSSDWNQRFAGNELAEIAINITARHLSDAGFPKAVVGELDASGVPRGNLQIEVTEQVLMDVSNSAMSGLRELRDAGVKVGLDDFGTGYSSLSYLRQFPLDFVKIDPSLIHDLVRTEGDRAIVAATIGLCHALDLLVVAEGVETRDQLDILGALDCDRIQGFLLAESGEPGALEELVETRSSPALQR
ncbi:MAG: EAL domain-containing protein [Actinomycetota bacterium]